MIPALLLGSTAVAMAVVANLTGSYGAALWASVLSPAATVAVVYDAHTRRTAGGDAA